MFSPFFSSFLGKRKEPSPVQSESESSSDDQETADDIINDDGKVEEEEEQVLIEEPEEPLDAEFDISTATLGQLLTRIIPDADVHCPNVIIIGGQSSGKTKMIISMVFHHLIENSSVTDAMGEKLLRIFRTGEKMVTRRPTKIQFVKTSKGSPCAISLRLGTESANFDDPKFDEIVDSVHQESANRDGKAFRGELRVTIAAPGLPNISFTDLPGLITDDRSLSDCHEAESMSIRKLVKAYMRQPQATLIVVEPASIEDFETSQVSPMLKDMKNNERPHIFNNAVLVLSKCDKIRQGLEGRIMSIIDGTSPNIRDFPYKHVVGVVNKIETAEEVADETLTYAAFKQQFKATKLHERAIFSTFLNRDQAPCSVKEQCTTAAVFHQMDKITFGLVHRSIEKGLESIQEKVENVEQKIRDELAPPIGFYDTLVPSSTVNGGVEISKAKRRSILKLLRINLKTLIASKFKSADLNIYDRHSYDVDRIAAGQLNFLRSNGVEWPTDFTPGDMLMSSKQADAIDLLRRYFNKYVDRKLKAAVSEAFADRITGCFAPIHSRFHRIDRFPRLVEALYQGFQGALPECVRATREAVSTYLVHFWEFEVPKGANLSGIVDQLKHVALRQMFETIRAETKGEQFDALLLDDTMFAEDEGFAALRNELQDRWVNLHQQAAILRRCNSVASNDDLRVTLQKAYEEEQAAARGAPAQDGWLEFWRRAETAPPAAGRSTRVNPPSTSMYSAEHELAPSSQNMDMDDATGMDNDSGSRMGAPEEQHERSNHRSQRDDATPFKRYKTGHDAADVANWASYKSNADVIAEGATAYMGSPLRSPAPVTAGSASSTHRLFGSFANAANTVLNNVFAASPQPAHATAALRFGASQSQSSQVPQSSQSQHHPHSQQSNSQPHSQSQSQAAYAAAAVVSAPSPVVKQEYAAAQQGHSQSSYGSIGGSESSAYGASSHAASGYNQMRTPSGAVTHGSHAASTPNGAQSSGRGTGSHGRDAESAQESKGTPEMIDLT